MSPNLGAAAKTKKGPNIGSDHLPLHIEIQVKAYLSIGKAPSWNFDYTNWDTWNDTFNKIVTNSSFYTTSEPRNSYQVIQNAFTEANSQSGVVLKKTKKTINREPPQLWWDARCKKAVTEARKAKNRCDPKMGGIDCESNRKK